VDVNVQEVSDPGENGGAYLTRLVATGSAVFAAGALRTAGRWIDLCTARSAALIELAQATRSSEPDAAQAQVVLRDEVVGLARELAEASWQETRTAMEHFDAYTRDDGADGDVAPTRLNRTKR
jgi:hypothetical protein